MRLGNEVTLLAVAFLVPCLEVVDGFVSLLSFPSKTFNLASCRIPSRLLGWNDDFADAISHNMARTCVRTFLTQRAIQSFMFLLESCRDPHTVKWFEDNFGFYSFDEYHGTGAFNTSKYGTWDSVLLDILSRPNEVIVISARRRGRGHGGWSKNNPYLPDRFVEFEIDVDPPSLVSRIMSVRDQIANEFVEDLDTMKSVNEKILQSYFSILAEARQQEQISHTDQSDSSSSTSSSESSGSTNNTNAYTRNAMFMLSNTMASNDQRSSPYRAGNFDLLVLLSTQESVHRVLRNYREVGSERDLSFEWFRQFYVDRVADFFDGNQPYGRADDFLEELLLTPPSFKKDANVVGLIDPLRIVEDIIRMRSLVTEEWKEIMANVDRDHVELRKALLTRQMNKGDEPRPPPPSRVEYTEGINFE